MGKILITGANRGIGFELTRQYLKQGDVHVFATCRTPKRAQQLHSLAAQHRSSLTILQLDITDEVSIQAAVNAIAADAGAGALDLLINNAGIAPRGDHQSHSLGNLSMVAVSEVVSTNAVGPLIVTQACHDLLKAGNNPRVVMISSGLGSIHSARGGSYAYRMSKAAMNMAARVLAFDEAMSGIITVTVAPGWVKTEMGGPNAAITPEESVNGLRTLIAGLTSDDKGRFFAYDGEENAW